MIGSPPGVGTLPPGWSQLVDPATVSDFTDLSFFPFFTVFFAMVLGLLRIFCFAAYAAASAIRAPNCEPGHLTSCT